MNLDIYDLYNAQNNPKNNHLYWSSKVYIKNSLDNILEKNKKKIKIKYLKIIDEIIEKNKKKNTKFTYKNINLIDLSLINEKNPYKSKSIYNCLKLLALENYLKIKKIKKIYYFGKNKNLDSSINELCYELNIKYKKKFFFNIQSYKILYFFKGVLFFIFYLLKNFKKHKQKKINATVTFFSYFQHLKNNFYFDSAYWSGINQILKKNYLSTNWFHFFVPSIKNLKIEDANKKINLFNLNSKYENHFIINSYLEFTYLIVIFFNFIRLFVKNIYSINKKFFFLNSNSKTNFKFFMHDDFSRSIFGDVLLYNLFNIATLDNIIKKIPKQKYGFFLMENQSWEIILLNLWRRYNHGKIFGFIHSTIRFWDLRYFKLKKKLHSINQNPDKILFNSNFYRKIAIQNYYPKKRCEVVEALRYINLKQQNHKKYNNKKILIIGDIDNDENFFLMNKISNIYKKINNYLFYYKPHPANTVKMIFELKKINKKIIFLNNSSQLNYSDFEAVICSNGTSATLDCIIKKVKFCTIKSYDALDLFPLNDDIKSKIQLSTENEIILFIKKKSFNKKFFVDINLDPSLNNWKKIIQNIKN